MRVVHRSRGSRRGRASLRRHRRTAVGRGSSSGTPARDSSALLPLITANGTGRTRIPRAHHSRGCTVCVPRMPFNSTPRGGPNVMPGSARSPTENATVSDTRISPPAACAARSGRSTRVAAPVSVRTRGRHPDCAGLATRPTRRAGRRVRERRLGTPDPLRRVGHCLGPRASRTDRRGRDRKRSRRVRSLRRRTARYS